MLTRAGFTADGLARAVAAVGQMLDAWAARPSAGLTEARVVAPPPTADTAALVQAARSIAEALGHQANWEPNGAVTWTAVEPVRGFDRFRVQALGLSLYGGACGVAIFLAAYTRTTGDRAYLPLARAAARAVQLAVDSPDISPITARIALTNGGTGAAFGFGSDVYSLFTLSHLLGDPSLAESALRAALRATPEILAACPEVDVLSGAAGFLLACLPVYNATREPRLLELLRAAARIAVSREPDLKLGFAHGPGGNACALSKLHAADPNPEWIRIAIENIERENAHFDPESRHWRDPRFPTDSPRVGGRWCGGTAGIGLARLAAHRATPRPEFHAGVERTLDFILDSPPAEGDIVCCGIFGGIEFLIEAARHFERPELLELARRHANAVASEALGRGHYRVNQEGNTTFHPAFFHGGRESATTFSSLPSPARSLSPHLGMMGLS